MNDTSGSVKLRWSETHLIQYEADVPVDQLPDELIDEFDDGAWEIRTGDVEHYEVKEFLEALVDAGGAEESSTMVENRFIEESDEVPPIMVTAAPIAAADVHVAGDDIPVVPQERFVEYAEEATEVTGITECERNGEHVPGSYHLWEECPTFNGQGD